MALIVRDSGRRWINGVIPFKLHPSVNANPGLLTAITQVQFAWSSTTPVSFVPQSNEPDFIEFRPVLSAPQCSSNAGRKGGKQEVLCASTVVGDLVHELGHAIGLYHEHQRPDRDASMAISAAAIAQRPQDFARRDGEQMVGRYDLESVMHYRWSTPDFRWTIEEIIAEGETVAERLIGRSTHQGEFMDVPPTGSRVEIPAVAMVRVREGKIAEMRGMPDMLGLMRQIGAVPAPGQSEGAAPSRPE